LILAFTKKNTVLSTFPPVRGSSSGVGFAIPIDPVKGMVEQLLTRSHKYMHTFSQAYAKSNTHAYLTTLSSTFPPGRGSSSGVGFAIPIDPVKGLVEQLLTLGRVSRPALGINLAPITILRAMKREGVMVLGVRTGGPAGKIKE
jgi:S1-C subfamily serine protease